MTRNTGRYMRLRTGREAFIPRPLPPAEPPLALDSLSEPLRKAEQALVKLELVGQLGSSFEWFAAAVLRKEAVVSAQLDGARSTLLDLLTWESQSRSASPDFEALRDAVDALALARERLSGPAGLSLRLLHETHRCLLRGARGADQRPGELRTTQTETAAFVPPPPAMVPGALGGLETYLNARDSMPPLLRAGLAHVQFETLRPYLDGNGRMGRMLISLVLEHRRVLTRPLLPLSLFFTRHRQQYEERLHSVRVDGDWESWLTFFLEGVATIADETIALATELLTLLGADRKAVLEADGASLPALQLFESLPRQPIVTISQVRALLQVTKPTASRCVMLLMQAGVLVETTGKRRDRSFVYEQYLKRLCLGTELAK